ncbi:MAG: RHS repeat-associated core domain-containing protein, partial [Bacteroidales bacterium]|nr:RHS repeat-associated core domain-containing protein [Bacteroidales bacterium]
NIGEGDAVPATDEFLSNAQKAWYPDAPMENVKNFSVENVPEYALNDMNANNAAGATYTTSIKGIYTGNSSVYFHPIRAFESAKRLFFVMGHEFIHVSQYCYLAGIESLKLNPNFNDLIEYHGYNYECALGSGNSGGFTQVDAINLSKLFSTYFNDFNYTNFSWTKTAKFIYPF